MKDPAAVRKRKLEAILYHVSFIQLNREGLKEYPQLLNTHSGTLQLLAELGFKTPVNEKKIFTNINDVVNFCLEFENKRDGNRTATAGWQYYASSTVGNCL